MAETPTARVPLPEEPIHRLVAPLERFLHIETASGIVLLVATVLALALANSAWSDGFLGLWETRVGFSFGAFELDYSLQHWINDGLMAVFFFVIGLEVKREMVIGELRTLRRAALPIAAALGGMVVPAGIYLMLHAGQPTARGWGIPMATDIAFVVGCLALLGPRVPRGFRVLLLSLAIADDIGAILVIAIGYTDNLNLTALVWGLLAIAAILGMQRLGVRSLSLYLLFGILVWFAFHESGVHATIAGVIVGLMTPARPYLSGPVFGGFLDRAGEVIRGEWETLPDRAEGLRRFRRATREMVSPLEYLEALLHPWVGFAIMPIFALANAGVPFSPEYLGDPVAVAIAAGLLIGKPVGVVLISWLAVRAGVAVLPDGVGWPVLAGGGLLAGIGFTMALFIAGLALGEQTLYAAKVGILVASASAAVLGLGTLYVLLPPRSEATAPAGSPQHV